MENRSIEVTASDVLEKQRFQAIFDETPIPYALNDDHQNIVRLNNAFIETFGYTLSEIPTLADWWPRAYPDEEYRRQISATWQKNFEQSKREGTTFKPIEAQIRCKDGITRIALVSAVSLTNRFSGTHLIVLQDITELRRIEQELIESNRLNMQILEGMPNGLIVMDHDWRYRVWNHQMEQMSGLSATEVLGKRPLEVFPFLRSTGVLNQLSRALSGETLTSSDFPFDVPANGRKGWSMQVMGPLRNSLNEIIGVLVNVIDVTARRKTESQLLDAIRSKEEILALLDTLQAKAPIGLAFVDRNCRYVRCNDALAEINGLSRAEHIGRFVWEVVPDLWPQLEADYRRILSGEAQAINREARGETGAQPGQIRSWRVSYYPVKNHEEIIGIGVIVSEDTEWRRAQEALKTSEERFRLLFEGASDAIFWADAATGLLINCNRAAEVLLGRERDEIIGQSHTFLHPPEEANRYRELFQTFAKTERKTDLEAVVLRKDGQRVAVSVAPSVTMIGGQRIVQGFFRDITERKMAEERLSAAEKRLETIFKSCPVGMCITTLHDGTLLEVNDICCAFGGFKREDVLGRNAAELGYWPVLDDRKKLVQDILENRSIKSDEFAFRHRDGTIGYTLRSIERLELDGQDCILSMFIDITERKRIDDELRASRQRLESLSRQLITTQEIERRHLARELHDEIGQVLTAIKIQLRRSQQLADASLQSNLNDVVEIVDQAIGQVRNLALKLRPAQLDELGLVAALHWLVKSQAHLGGIKEEFEVEVGNYHIPPEIETVCFRIAQEALTNAIRHAKSTTVRVRLWATDNKLFLSIQDDGVGFDVNETYRRALGGGSFGLVSMQERAKLADGRVQIESALGEGTTIHAWFPLGREVVA